MANESLLPITFKNIIDIIERRAGIAGEAQPRDRLLIKDVVNEINQTISTERSWRWRKKDRSFTFKTAITDGTVDATNGSRIITMNNFNVADKYLGRSIRINETLSNNFNLSEFHCKCKYESCTYTYLDTDLIDYLQSKRDLVGLPFTINSGFRCTSIS